MPVLIVVAGPNGSGKSTLTAMTRLQRARMLIDPDAIARRLDPQAPQRAAMQAGRASIALSRACIAEGQSFVLETTLAGHGPVATMRDAVAAGFRTYVVYVALGNPELQSERVGLRMLRGGHDVPDEDVRRRYQRSLDRAPEALRLADRAVVIDNSGLKPVRKLILRRGSIVWRAADLPPWVAEIARQIAEPHSS